MFAMKRCFIGTSGFSLQHFYPLQIKSADRLAYFATIFPTVEINSTFYHLPRIETITNWQQSVSKSFVFTFKAAKTITHVPGMLYDVNAATVFFERFQSFETPDKKHLFLFQFPASKTCNVQSFQELLDALPDGFRYAFEFRHHSWFIPEIIALVKKHESTLVISDAPLKQNGEQLWPDYRGQDFAFTYIRFHGRPKLYYSSYTEEMLREYVPFIEDRLSQGNQVFCYFNNDAAGHAAANAGVLTKLLHKSS